MAQLLPTSIFADPLPSIAPPKGWRTLPASHPHEGGTYLSPGGLYVDVMDVAEDGKRYRRMVLSRRGCWPSGDDVELVVRLFLRLDRPWTLTQLFGGTGLLRLQVEHDLDGPPGASDQAARLAQRLVDARLL